jgi:polysaccharide deacetylase family protein (PEP-CTERM system associated)
MQNVLTIDLEEYFQVHAFENVIPRRDWERYPSRVAVGTRRLLRLLEEHGVRATFFVLGWVADRQPELLREIVAGGHEIATHGYWHQLIYRQTPSEFAADLRQALEAIRSSVGDDRPLGYRAPGFSITNASLWALDVLRDHGFRYDSSIFPLVAHDRYGLRGAPRFAHRVENGLWEFPLSTWRLGGQNWPVAGGGYFRLYPLWVTRHAIRRLNATSQPAIAYLHPWEFDPEQPVVANAPPLSRFRHYVNLGKTEARLRALLGEFDFAPMREVFAGQLRTSA